MSDRPRHIDESRNGRAPLREMTDRAVASELEHVAQIIGDNEALACFARYRMQALCREAARRIRRSRLIEPIPGDISANTVAELQAKADKVLASSDDWIPVAEK